MLLRVSICVQIHVVWMLTYVQGQLMDCSNTTLCKPPCSGDPSTPRSFHWYVGETLSWNCSLEEKCAAATSADIHFCYKGKSVPEALTRIVDSRTKELRIPNVTTEYSGAYFCYVAGCYVDDIEMQIGYPAEAPQVHVTYEYMTGVASNLTVQATPTDRNRNVTWRWQVRYKLNTRSPSMYYEDLNEFCPAYRSNPKNSCNEFQPFPCGCPQWKQPGQCVFGNYGGDGCFLTDMNHTFQVNMSSPMFGSAIVEHTVFISNSIAIPPPVYKVKFEESSRGSLIKWSMWSTVIRNVVYRLYYRPLGEDAWTDLGETEKLEFRLTKLAPNRLYRVKIHSKFKVGSKLSKGEMAEFRTLESAPAESPKLSAGSYMIGAECAPGVSTLLLYTQDIPEDKQNGNLTNIVLVFEPELPEQRNPVNSSASNSTVVICGVEKSLGYSVQLRVGTRAGLSQEPSLITIPASRQAPGRPVQVVAEQISRGTVRVKWRIQSPILLPHNFTIHYCKLVDRFSKEPTCLSDYGWSTFPGDGVFSHNVTVNHADRMMEYRFGVSLDTPGGSSGISWSSCLYDSSSGPKAVENLQVQPFRTNLTAKWSPPKCSQPTSYPKWYEISYGTTSAQNDNSTAICSKGSQLSLEDNRTSGLCIEGVDGTTTCETSLKNLEEGQWYFVCVRGTSPFGQGEWAFPIQRQTYKEPANIYPWIAGAVVAVVSLLIIGVFCAVRCYQRDRDKDREDLKVEAPPPVHFTTSQDDIAYHTVSTTIGEDSNMSNGTANGSVPHMGPLRMTNGGLHVSVNPFRAVRQDSPGPDSPDLPDSLWPDSPVHNSVGSHSPVFNSVGPLTPRVNSGEPDGFNSGGPELPRFNSRGSELPVMDTGSDSDAVSGESIVAEWVSDEDDDMDNYNKFNIKNKPPEEPPTCADSAVFREKPDKSPGQGTTEPSSLRRSSASSGEQSLHEDSSVKAQQKAALQHRGAQSKKANRSESISSYARYKPPSRNGDDSSDVSWSSQDRSIPADAGHESKEIGVKEKAFQKFNTDMNRTEQTSV